MGALSIKSLHYNGLTRKWHVWAQVWWFSSGLQPMSSFWGCHCTLTETEISILHKLSLGRYPSLSLPPKRYPSHLQTACFKMFQVERPGYLLKKHQCESLALEGVPRTSPRSVAFSPVGHDEQNHENPRDGRTHSVGLDSQYSHHLAC